MTAYSIRHLNPEQRSRKKSMTQTETKRGPGRPASFEGQKTVAFLAKIPTDTRDMIRELAEKREEPINVTADAMLRRGYREMTRK